jgi:hypothetical protein
MWMRSCAICKTLLKKLKLVDSVRCQCGWEDSRRTLPTHFSFSKRSAARSIISHSCHPEQSRGTLRGTSAKTAGLAPFETWDSTAPASSVSFSPFRSIRPVLPTRASFAETTCYSQV